MVNKLWNGKITGLISFIYIGINLIINKFLDHLNTFIFITNVRKHGKKIKVQRGFTYRFPRVIEVGSNIIIGRNTKFTSELASGHYLKIEDSVSIGSGCHIDFTGGIEIKNYAHIAHGVLISTHDHGYDYNSVPIGKKLVIENKAFIGSRVVIMHNCNYIGKSSVIGTGSIITKDVPDFAVVVGNPGKIVKYLNYDKKS